MAVLSIEAWKSGLAPRFYIVHFTLEALHREITCPTGLPVADSLISVRARNRATIV